MAGERYYSTGSNRLVNALSHTITALNHHPDLTRSNATWMLIADADALRLRLTQQPGTL